jgi:hypothetical protein
MKPPEWLERAQVLPIGSLRFCCALLLLAFFAAPPSWAAATPAPKVAIFFEPGFPSYGGVSDQVSPAYLAKELKKAGIDADLLDTPALADPKRFNAKSYAALVLIYGNTYPEQAFNNIRVFHAAGGSLVTTGIPFTHAVAHEPDGSWQDQGHRSEPALFGPAGLGVGGFSGPGPDSAPVKIAPGDPLGLAPLKLDWSQEGSVQWLDPASLPAQDSVVPAVMAGDHPLAAIIAHHAPPFAGVIDAWTYRGPGDQEPEASEQLLLHATVAVLARRGLMSEAQESKALAFFDQEPRPFVYTNIVLPKLARPYPTFQPKMPSPAKHLYVADIQKLTPDQKLLLLSLQGLVNRKQPRIYLVQQGDDLFWLDWMQQNGHTSTPIPVADPMTLVLMFRKEIHGAVVPDPKVYITPDIAADVASVDDLVIATPALASQLHLPIKADLRGRFKDDPDALHFLRTMLLPRMNRYFALCLDPAILDTGAIDQIIAAKGIAFWITGGRAQNLPGANGPAEEREVEAILADMPLEAVVRGFWWRGDGVGIDEGPGVALASRFGKVTVVSDYVANFSVFSGVSAPALHQKPQPPAPPLDRSKVYLAITMSDGDNLCTWRSYFRDYFQDPLHGTFPVGWGMGPTLVDCAPDWAEWYYQHAAPTDEFICDVSGVGYIYPPDWATALKDRDEAFGDFYTHWTQEYMRRMDMKTIRLMGVSAPDIARTAKLLPDVHFLMPDYGYAGEGSYGEITYTLPTGQTVFRAITTGSGPAGLASQVRDRVGNARPAFVNVFIWNWGSKLSDLKQMLDDLGPGYVAVTPSQLQSLYQEAHNGQPNSPR